FAGWQERIERSHDVPAQDGVEPVRVLARAVLVFGVVVARDHRIVLVMMVILASYHGGRGGRGGQSLTAIGSFLLSSPCSVVRLSSLGYAPRPDRDGRQTVPRR